jgi:DNA-binding PadR family transcriptional regulator
MAKKRKSLKTAHFHILLALSNGDLHGFGIQRDVDTHSQGRCKLWPATLYGSLEELSDLGWIEEVIDPAERPAESEKRRYYRITPTGLGALSEEAERIAELAALAKARVGAHLGGGQ